MRSVSVVLLCAGLALAPAGCTSQQETVAEVPDEADGTRFEVTPAVGVATGATVIVALGIMAVIACGIACAGGS